MAKVQIKSEKLTPFGGIFSIMEQFDSMLSPIIDQTLGQRCSSIIGYQYSEIIRSLMSVYFCGGSCVEDVTSHLMRHLSYHPTLRTCSSDTILRAIKELQEFGDQLEAACFDTLNDGIATKDLVNLMEGVEAKAVNSAGFIAAIRERLEKRLG